MPIRSFTDYREFLREVLAMRVKRNPHYSQRAFARDLGLLPSRLNQILNGKLGLSPVAALQLAGRLGLQSGERDFFYDLVLSQSARSGCVRDAAAARVRAADLLESDSATTHDFTAGRNLTTGF